MEDRIDARIERIDKKKNILIIFAAMTFAAAIFLFIIKNDLRERFRQDTLPITVVAGAMMLYSVGALLYIYLQYGFKNSVKDKIQFSQISEEIEVLKLELLKLSKNSSSIEQNDIDINEQVSAIIEKHLDENQLLNKLEIGLINRKIKDTLSKPKDIHERINVEIERLSKSANINLALGSVTTLLAICILGYEVFYNPITFKEIIPLLSHYIPRLTIIILVEIFAFFFLKIYKANLSEIKYFHNEKTNIDLKLKALEFITYESAEMKKIVVEELVKTERNFILKKDESTAELRKEAIEADANNKFVESLTSIIKSKG